MPFKYICFVFKNSRANEHMAKLSCNKPRTNGLNIVVNGLAMNVCLFVYKYMATLISNVSTLHSTYLIYVVCLFKRSE